MCGLLTLIKKNINENEINKFKLSLNKINYRGPDFSKVQNFLCNVLKSFNL